MFKGKLTYTALAGILTIAAGKLFGVEITEGDIGAVSAGVLALVAVYGRWRSTRSE